MLPDLFLPRHPSFDSQLLDQQLVLYSLRLFLAGPPDILIVGSSRAIQGVEPFTLQQALIEQGYPKLDIYNFSINGATAQVINLLLSRILTTDQIPSLVIWADGSRAFNNGRPDRTYDQILDSEGLRQLDRGNHPIAYRQPQSASSESCQDTPHSFFSVQGNIADLHPVNISLPQLPPKQMSLEPLSLSPFRADVESLNLFDHPACSLENTTFVSGSTSLQPHPPFTTSLDFYPSHHRMLHSLQPSLHSSNGVTLPQSTATHLYRNDSLRHMSALPFELDASGFLANPMVFEPTAYYQNYPYVAGAYDSNYVPFNLQGSQDEAARSLITYLESNNISLVFANLPLTQGYLDQTRSMYERTFIHYMENLAAESSLTFVNLHQANLTQNQYFADPSHLNEYGARAVAKQMATQATIPWPHSRPLP